MKKSEIESYKKAGKIAKEVKEFARGLVRPGVKLIDIAEAVDSKIEELGGGAAFPVNLSLNEVAAHYTPEPGDETVAKGILKVDIGVEVDGYIADTAFSVDLTSEGEYKEMIELNEKILSNISDRIFSRLGEAERGEERIPKSVDFDEKGKLMVKDVGETAMGTLEAFRSSRGDGRQETGDRYSIIKSLSGHALGKNKIHAGLTISNYRNENKTELSDMAFAIEPFVTSGVGDIFEGKAGGIYVLKDEGVVRDKNAREVLKFVREKFKTRPFCLRWLVKEFEDLSLNKLKFVLGMLVRSGVLYEYPMLIEKSRKPVSQIENTFLVFGDEVFCTTG